MPRVATSLARPVARVEGAVQAEEARARLKDAGVCVDLLGGVAFTDDAAQEYCAGPWAHDLPLSELNTLRVHLPQEPVVPMGAMPARAPKRLASRIFRHLEALAATRLWRELPAFRREAMLSSGGSGNGAVWQCLLTGVRTTTVPPTSAQLRAAGLVCSRLLAGQRVTSLSSQQPMGCLSFAVTPWTSICCTLPCARWAQRECGLTAALRLPWRGSSGAVEWRSIWSVRSRNS